MGSISSNVQNDLEGSLIIYKVQNDLEGSLIIYKGMRFA